ncbi:hypothetical protein LWC34_24275 [Kibdelosporangium philippinense]|uniref:Uncharacterized protein n=1 Tax=Kibdelosporangium philippinense TaxID=211113 RepID=A0ABS8ZJB5_9PSEU|nr:hypothetical protein [Kibdelosporangium philippinense]MCE7005922.1 hypothetical protein [Kibdelosporangium philippinense]
MTLFMVAPAGMAFAQDSTNAMPVTVAGPVGIAVAAVGLTGMVLGLWRFMRKSAKDKAAAAEVMQAPTAPVAVVEPEPAPQPATP